MPTGNPSNRKLESLYRKERSRLYAIALGILHSPSEAEDAVHDAFGRLLSAEIKHIHKPKGLLVVAVTNAALSILRRRGRELRYRMEIANESFWETVPDASPLSDAQQYTEHRERKEQLFGMMDDLPQRLSDVLLLRYYHDLSYAQIGVILGISEGAARKRAFDGLRILRERWGKGRDDP